MRPRIDSRDPLTYITAGLQALRAVGIIHVRVGVPCSAITLTVLPFSYHIESICDFTDH